MIFIIILSFASCDFNGPLRKKMLTYYSDDMNYKTMEGIIKSIDGKELTLSILTENHDFSVNTAGDLQDVILIENGSQHYDLKVGDTIVFTSAPMYFYNGHKIPIVSLQKGDTIYLTFEEGKRLYLEWIQKTFD